MENTNVLGDHPGLKKDQPKQSREKTIKYETRKTFDREYNDRSERTRRNEKRKCNDGPIRRLEKSIDN